MVLASVLASMAAGTCVADPTPGERLRHNTFARRASTLIEPMRPSGPLRAVNISDLEVREIQAAAATVLPKAIVTIGSVTSGCPCQDGPECTDQVWVIASTAVKTRGLLFSRIDDTWGVGPVQKWWMEYLELDAHPEHFPKYSEFLAAEAELVDRMPVCASGK